MKVLYVAGPYRAEGWNGVFENVIKAREYARRFWLHGWAVICPHANSIFMDGPDIEPMTFIDGDLEIIRRCDAIFMLPRWEQSEGAKLEHALAVKLGIPIYVHLEQVPDANE